LTSRQSLTRIKQLLLCQG